MDNQLALQVQSENFVITTDDLARIMEEVKSSFEQRNWEEVITWRELVYHKLKMMRYWREYVQINEWAIEAAQGLSKIREVARFTHDLADIRSLQGYHAQAELLYQRSYELYEYQVGDHTTATKSLHMLSLTKRTLGKRNEAEALAYECLKRAETLAMGAWQAHPLHLLAWIARDQGNHGRALSHLTAALEIHENHNEHDRLSMLAQSHYDIARTLVLAGRLAEAKSHIQKVRSLDQTDYVQQMSYRAAKLYGDIALAEGAGLRALEFYHHALDRAQTGPDERSVAVIYLDLAHVYWRLGRLRKSFNYFRSGLSQLHRLGLFKLSRIWSELLWFLKH